MRFHPVRLLRLIIGCGLGLLIIATLFYYYNLPEPHSNDSQQQPLIQRQPPPSDGRRINWENEDLNRRELSRSGPGEQGRPVNLEGREAQKAKAYRFQNGFNTYVSDLISVNRSVRDLRHVKCKSKLYSSSLPQASIIIPYFNEHLATLMRTVHSSIRQAGLGLIKEVILVDDGSTRPLLAKQLDEYLREVNFQPKGFVRVLRLGQRQGLIRARLAGASEALGEVLVFLDSHCEASPNWLPPLLDLIAADYRNVACPLIDIIAADTFAYKVQDEGARGAFDWELYYKRLPRLEESLAKPEEPFDTPVMAGGLFAISSRWFNELGTYDPELAIWGGEQYELSFKIWMCGGRMFEVPCSRVGHIYRGYKTDFPSIPGDFVGRNYKRVAEVWMDGYTKYLYQRRPHYKAIDAGELSDRRAIRERLQCKSFEWFMHNVAFDLTKHYPLVEPIPAASGAIRSLVTPRLCIDAPSNDSGNEQQSIIKVAACDSGSGRQQFELTFRDDIRLVGSTSCFDRSTGGSNARIVLYPCHGQHGNQHWAVMPRTAKHDGTSPDVELRHVPSATCLQMGDNSLFTASCNAKIPGQGWLWDTLKLDVISNASVPAT